MELRRAVVEVLSHEKKVATCFRYACCGLGDQLVQRGDEVFASPKGCGHKLCPRCGRRRGGKYARRIIGWLANRPHGDLWSMCLTQRVIGGEALKDAKARMEKKARKYMRWLTRSGMSAGMTAVHIVWSTRAEGWHYHVHVLADVPAGQMSKLRLLDKWAEIGGDEKLRTDEKQARLVVSAGAAIAELQDDAGDMEFWTESKGPIARAVQYPLRDLAQGVSAGRLGESGETMKAVATELVRDAAGWKCYRAWGAWAKACPVEEKEPEAEGADGEEKKAAPGAPAAIDTVGRVWRAARRGCEASREVLRKFERSVRNESDFARRLVEFCRAAWTPGHNVEKG